MRTLFALLFLFLSALPAAAQEDPANPVAILKTNNGDIHLGAFPEGGAQNGGELHRARRGDEGVHRLQDRPEGEAALLRRG